MSELPHTLSTTLPKNGKTTFLVVDLRGEGIQGAKESDVIIQNVDKFLNDLTSSKFMSVYSAFAPLAKPHGEVNIAEKRVLQAVPGVSPKAIVYTGLYLTSDSLTFLLIFFTLMGFYYMGLSSLISIQGNQGMEVQPPPVGKEA
jgi:hypothetical protein